MSDDEFTLQTNGGPRGNLYIAEVAKQIPFDIKRFYLMTDVPPGGTRGTHAHKHTDQAVLCIHGSFNVLLDDGADKLTVRLDSPEKGLLLRSRVWHSLSDFSDGAIALVVASEIHDESDYIRDYEEFLAYIK